MLPVVNRCDVLPGDAYHYLYNIVVEDGTGLNLTMPPGWRWTDRVGPSWFSYAAQTKVQPYDVQIIPRWDGWINPAWIVTSYFGYAPTSSFYTNKTAGPLLSPATNQDLSRYPHFCPKCQSPAYIGLNQIDCMEGCK